MMSALITDLDQIKHLAAARHDEFEVMRYLLELADELEDVVLDARVEATAAPIIAAIDCTQCGNCCRVLDVYLIPADAGRVAEGIDVPLAEIMMHYVDDASAKENEEWGKFRIKPCAFLKGKLCSVYAHRPESCRTYPVFTPDFRWTLTDTIEGAALCPIIYNVLSAVAQQVEDWLKDTS